jgi:hypothetical protein
MQTRILSQALIALSFVISSTAHADSLYVTSGGVGINKSDPSYDLDVGGNVRLSGQTVVTGGSETINALLQQNALIFTRPNAASYLDQRNGGDFFFRVTNSDVSTTYAWMKLRAYDGDLVVGADLWTNKVWETSDPTLKTNIRPLVGSLSSLSSINGVSFEWTKSGERSIGVLADQVEQVYPELVALKETELVEGEKEYTKAVNYSGLIGVLIEAVKEQQVQIEALQAQVEILAERLK